MFKDIILTIKINFLYRTIIVIVKKYSFPILRANSFDPDSGLDPTVNDVYFDGVCLRSYFFDTLCTYT